MGIEREDRTLLPPATPLCFVRGAGYFSHLSCFIVLCFLILLTTFNRPIILFRCSVMISAAAAAAKSLQLCRTLCDPIDSSPPGSSVPGILQARTLEWVAISFSRVSSQSRDRTWVSHVVGRRFIVWATRVVINCIFSFWNSATEHISGTAREIWIWNIYIYILNFIKEFSQVILG